MNPTAKISSSHLSRLVIVYVRQSTVAQVRQNTESTNRQYGLAGTAAELGWLAEQIVVVGDGEVSVKQAAAQLGIPADAVYNWLRLGQVPARRGASGRWCIPWDPATQEIYRQKVAGSFRLTPGLSTQRTTAGTESPPHSPPR